MRIPLFLATFAWLLVGLTGTLSAAPNEVLLVFNGNTEVNRHVYSGLTQVLGGSGFKVVATLNTGAAKPGAYKAVVVVSTRVTSGVDPKLEEFLKSYPAPQELLLVTLLSRSSDFTVTPFTKASGPGGVDGVSAATAWVAGSRQMHAQWMQWLAKTLAGR